MGLDGAIYLGVKGTATVTSKGQVQRVEAKANAVVIAGAGIGKHSANRRDVGMKRKYMEFLCLASSHQ